MKRFAILSALTLLLTLGLATTTTSPAAACDHHRRPSVHHHHGHCHWVAGHHETRWQWTHGGHWQTRQVFDGYRDEQRRVPSTREVYDVATDTYVTKTDYDTSTSRVPVYRTERVWVNGSHRVQVTVWVPGYWTCCHGCFPHPVPPCGCRG